MILKFFCSSATQGICIDLLLLQVFNGFSLNELESFISEKECFEAKAGFDADAERSGGPKWDMNTCACAKAQLQNAPAFSVSGNDSCIREIIIIIQLSDVIINSLKGKVSQTRTFNIVGGVTVHKRDGSVRTSFLTSQLGMVSVLPGVKLNELLN